MTDRQSKSTSADGCGKWYIVEVLVRERILVEVSDGEDDYDAEGIALEGSRLFQQTEKDFEVEVVCEQVPDDPERLVREMRHARLVIPMWDGDK